MGGLSYLVGHTVPYTNLTGIQIVDLEGDVRFFPVAAEIEHIFDSIVINIHGNQECVNRCIPV